MDTTTHTRNEWPEFAAIARARGWDDPERARGQCSFASEEFVRWLGEGDMWGSHMTYMGNHVVAVLPDGRAVDWTARQFGPDADFPTVYPSLDAAFPEDPDPEHLFSVDGGIDWASIVGTPEDWAADSW